MLSVHILNVGHGDSIVLEYRENGESAFAVIDSNCRANETPKALEKLRLLNAESLSFVAVTHPHADHYLGMKAILEAFEDKVDNIYTFPIEQDSQKLQEIAKKYREAAANASDSPEIGRIATEFLHIFKHARKSNWETPMGTHSSIVAPGFNGVEISVILPPANKRSNFYNDLINGKVQIESKNQNDLSLAFLIKYKNHQIVLGGDGTYDNWIYQAKRWEGVGLTLSPVAAKLPHHGSKKDSGKHVLDIIYGDSSIAQQNSVACISSEGGAHHPHHDVIDSLVSKGIKPYCTNLAARCGANIKGMISNPNIDAALLRLLNSSLVQGSFIKEQACQGDICLEISDNGEFSVKTEHKHLCQYRGDYSFLPTSIQ